MQPKGKSSLKPHKQREKLVHPNSRKATRLLKKVHHKEKVEKYVLSQGLIDSYVLDILRMYAWKWSPCTHVHVAIPSQRIFGVHVYNPCNINHLMQEEK